VVSQNRRYNPGLVAFRRLVLSRLGGIGALSADFYSGYHFEGFREEMASPLLLDMAVHTFDAARYYHRCGCPERLLYGVQPAMELVPRRASQRWTSS